MEITCLQYSAGQVNSLLSKLGETKIKLEFHHWPSPASSLLYFYKIHQNLKESEGKFRLVIMLAVGKGIYQIKPRYVTTDNIYLMKPTVKQGRGLALPLSFLFIQTIAL